LKYLAKPFDTHELPIIDQLLDTKENLVELRVIDGFDSKSLDKDMFMVACFTHSFFKINTRVENVVEGLEE